MIARSAFFSALFALGLAACGRDTTIPVVSPTSTPIAANAREALEKLQNETFDLVILDIRLPGKTGTELLPEIKAGNDSSSGFV